MNISLAWLLSYLDSSPLTAAAVEHALTHTGFPIESQTNLSDGDVRLDVEITSNRGDCLSHVGLAREVAAKLNLPLRAPSSPMRKSATPVGAAVSLSNDVPECCPRFIVRVIRGVKVGPSPKWLSDRLEAAGQRPINNVVDITNFINLELGNPCHAFDLAKLAGNRLQVRWAKTGESLTTLDGKSRKLKPDELVVADGERAQSLAGVMGGGDSEVSSSTTDVVLEVATWDPVTVRRAARRHGLRTDASYRYERVVPAATLEAASRRGAALIAEVAGGEILSGALVAGPASDEPQRVKFRPRRCTDVLGYAMPVDDMVRLLGRLGIESGPLGRGGEELLCTIPPHRADLTREIDLIEEVGRVNGLDVVPMLDKLPIRVRPPQASEEAQAELARVLTGLGFFETVTFSFVSRPHAQLFLSTGDSAVEVDDERRAGEPALRPSILPGLLECRRKNLHARVRVEGGVRLCEFSATFNKAVSGAASESRRVALLLDVPGEGRMWSIPKRQFGIRVMRGAIERMAQALGGSEAIITIQPAAPTSPAWDRNFYGDILLQGRRVGAIGMFASETLAAFDLDLPVVGAELDMASFIALYPPRAAVSALPAFPGTERDVSIIVPERIAWSDIEAAASAHRKAPLEKIEFVTTYRGEQAGKGNKSVTLRLSFRDPGRTLRAEEADAPTAALVEALKQSFGAVVRA